MELLPEKTTYSWERMAMGHTFKRGRMRPMIWVIRVLMVLVLIASVPISAWASPGPNPAPKVLLLWSSLNWNGTEERDNVVSILSTMTPAPVVDTCDVTDPNGDISNSLTACGYSLANYCQVWDLRFLFNTSGGPYADNISTADQTLYTNFLTSGGRLFIMGETSAFHPRNDGLMIFLNNISNGGPIGYPTNCKSNCCCSTFPADPLNFNSTPNVLTGTTTGDPGLIPFTAMGSARPLATLAGTGAEAFGFEPADMTTGAGRLMVEMDANFFRYAVGSMPAGNVAFIENAYNWLGSGCDKRFVVTKTTSVAPPNTVCIGTNFTYTLCVQNVGTASLPATIISDTFPSCFSYISSTLAPTTHTGNYLEWTIGPVAVGATACVTVTVSPVSLPPCP